MAIENFREPSRQDVSSKVGIFLIVVLYMRVSEEFSNFFYEETLHAKKSIKCKQVK